MRRLGLLAATAGLATIPLTAPVPAHALDCAGPEWINGRDADIDHLFLGRVVDARDNSIRVAVTETWRGDRLPEHVWLQLDDDTFWYAFADRRGHVPDGYSSRQPWVMATNADLDLGVCSYWAPVRSVRRVLEPDQPLPPLTGGSGSTVEDPVDSPEPVSEPVRGAVEPPDGAGPAVRAAAVVLPVGLLAGAGWWWRRRTGDG